MINFGSNPAFILGIALALCGVALYAMRSVRPELSRDHDIFFAAIALVSGLILMFQGWRLDPLLLLGQLALAGSAVFFAVENIRLRNITTEQAKRNKPIVDDERPVSRSYEYDYDYDYRSDVEELPYSDDRRPARRIRATRDERDSGYDDYGASRRRPSASRRLETRDDARPSSSRRRPLPRARQHPEDAGSSRRSDWDDDRWSSSRPSRADQWSDNRWDDDQRRAQPSVEPPAEPRIKPPVDSPVVGPTIEPVASSDPVTSSGSTYRSGGREPKSLSRYRSRRRSADRYSGGSMAATGGGGDYADYQPMNYGDDSPSGDDYGDRYR